MIPEGIPLYVQYGSPRAPRCPSVYNLSAVSGVLATRRDTYRQLGGLDPEFGELALIEYCLRATDAGQRVVIVPDARLRATGPDLTINDLPRSGGCASLGPNPHPRPLLQPQLPHRPRRLHVALTRGSRHAPDPTQRHLKAPPISLGERLLSATVPGPVVG